ncbi:MAG: hypothetical protein RBT63_00400 [Bdellovibrionales bacterium]|nr:hypothetical protein [Bdellovibrionales bacterium]
MALRSGAVAIFGVTLVLLASQQAVAAVNLATLFSKAKASETQSVCYAREYSESHLEAKPLQRVKKMSLKLNRIVNDEQVYYAAEVDLKLKTVVTDADGETYIVYKSHSNAFSCLQDGQCYIDCDGGRAKVATLSRDRDSLTFVNEGFVVHGGCGGSGVESERVFLDAVKSGDDVFKLYRLRSEACSY